MFTQRSVLHSSPRWFSSRHSSISGGGGDRCGRVEGARATQLPLLLVPAGFGRAPSRPPALLHPAHPRSALGRRRAGSHPDTRTRLRRAAARSGRSHSGTRPNPPLSCPLLRPRRNTDVSTAPGNGCDPCFCPLCPPLHSPRRGFPSSRGLASQKELLSLCDVGHWDPGRGSQWSARPMHRRSCPPTLWATLL